MNVSAVVLVSPSTTRGASIDSEGVLSSSTIESVRLPGVATPLVPVTVAETVTVLFGPSLASSVAVIVTVPVLAVAPAASVNVLTDDSVKSPACAFMPAVADTVNVTASLDTPLRRAVTVVVPPFSTIDAGVRFRATVGVGSSSVNVRAAPVTAPIP